MGSLADVSFVAHMLFNFQDVDSKVLENNKIVMRYVHKGSYLTEFQLMLTSDLLLHLLTC